MIDVIANLIWWLMFIPVMLIFVAGITALIVGIMLAKSGDIL